MQKLGLPHCQTSSCALLKPTVQPSAITSPHTICELIRLQTAHSGSFVISFSEFLQLTNPIHTNLHQHSSDTTVIICGITSLTTEGLTLVLIASRAAHLLSEQPLGLPCTLFLVCPSAPHQLFSILCYLVGGAAR